jgi:prepilin-type N-terminal cleavage/methylation domain-containing protein
MSQTHDALRRAQGFTLVEVMITLVILGFGILTLALMQLYSIRQGSQGRHTGDSSAIARSYLEQTSRLPWSALDGAVGTAFVNPGWANLPATATVVNSPNGNATEHSYTIQWRVTNLDGPPVCLRDVEVRVRWDEEDRTTQKEQVIGTRRYNEGDASC